MCLKPHPLYNLLTLTTEYESHIINNEAETACRARAAYLPCQPALRQCLMMPAWIEDNHIFYSKNHSVVYRRGLGPP